MTPAGATFPGGKDPQDTNIRIAPSFPPINDLKTAAELLALSTKLVTVEHLLANMESSEPATETKAKK